MKTLRILGMALIAVLMCAGFAACDNDDDGLKTDKELLIGTWEYSDNAGMLMTFRSDGTGNSYHEGSEDSASPFTWNLNGTQLDIKYNTYSSMMIIKDITETALLVTDKRETTVITFVRR